MAQAVASSPISQCKVQTKASAPSLHHILPSHVTHEVCPMVLRLPCGLSHPSAGLSHPSAPPATGLPGPVTLPQAPTPGGTPRGRVVEEGAEGSAASPVNATPELALLAGACEGGDVTSQQRPRVLLGARGGGGGGFDSKGHGNAHPLPLPPPLHLPLPLPLPLPLSASGEGAILPGTGRICVQQVDKENPAGRNDIQLLPESMLFCSLSREGTELEALAQGEREGSTGTARSGVRLGVRASSFA